ncbi:MAG: RecQ family ATP-dependent DNA helicase, partial [Chloroflexi bacterium]|nr:RecQ family ATP-dependent DNA helicase [Chloroflexota bacterium]
GDIPVLALTATATDQVSRDIIRSLGMRKPAGFKGSFFRANLRIIAQKKGGGRNSRRDMLNVIRAHRDESGIVYCASRKGVDELAKWLSEQGVRALAYHAGLDDQTRARHQNAFARDEVNVVVATVAFGMGIDKSNVRFVIHRDMPRSIEAWYQEIGRAGRDGLPSDCVVLFSWSEIIAYDRFLSEIEDSQQRNETRQRTIALFNLLDRGGCRHRALVDYFNQQIPACGEACDACLGRGLDDLFARSASASRMAREPSWRTPSWRTAELQYDRATAESDPDLFDRLRVLRRQIADSEGVPAYIVFSDAVLREMSRRAPKTEREMLSISGIGPAKLTRYGQAFLRVLSADA